VNETNNRSVIDEKLLKLINEYENEQLTPTELAISSGKTLKIKKGKNLSFSC
jgi:hypothetical protein